MLKNAKNKIDASVFQKTILNLYNSVKPRYSQRKQPTSRDAATSSSCCALLTDIYDAEKKSIKNGATKTLATVMQVQTFTARKYKV